MKAIVYTEYGSPDVLSVRERPKPEPKEKEIRVRVHATSVNYGDLIARNFRAVTPRSFNMPALFWLIAKISFGWNRPKSGILGSEFSGVVDAAGSGVAQFKPGDAVFGYLGQSMGAYAEYACLPEDGAVAAKPENMTHEEAAVVPYGTVRAVHLLRKGGIAAGRKVLINGASGSMGSAAVQIAKSFGAEVTGVCSTPRTEFVRSLGADHVIDYTKEDFTEGDTTYDLVFDVLGRSSFVRCRRVLAPDGRYLLASFKMKQLLQMLRTSMGGGQKVLCSLAPGGQEDLLAVRELIEAGKIRAFIDGRFSLESAADAHRHVEEGRKRGHVVITVA
jgi:NADPH:quinone reductase-like Zn-dependent oxidoreductase